MKGMSAKKSIKFCGDSDGEPPSKIQVQQAPVYSAAGAFSHSRPDTGAERLRMAEGDYRERSFFSHSRTHSFKRLRSMFIFA